MRALILTNQFFHYAGAEMVALELAEELRRRDFSVSLMSNEIDGELKERLLQIGVIPLETSEDLDIFDFDLVWSQHHILPQLFLGAIERGVIPASWPLLVFSHLSPYDPAEVPGPFIERHVADLILANSPETAEKLKEYGDPFDQAELFSNPAPPGFAQINTNPKTELDSLLVVSNHRNSEIGQALRKLSLKGIRVTRIGRRQAAKRVTPRMIKDHDAVLTIGKTVQYALRGGRPVFCYDRFGGPGWLTAMNFEKAAWYNFSGRDTQNQRLPDVLADEIMEGYKEGRDFAASLDDKILHQYTLELRVDEILEKMVMLRDAPTRYEERFNLYLQPSFVAMVRHEARIAAIYKKEFLHRRGLEVKKRRRRKLLAKVRQLSKRYLNGIRFSRCE